MVAVVLLNCPLVASRGEGVVPDACGLESTRDAPIDWIVVVAGCGDLIDFSPPFHS